MCMDTDFPFSITQISTSDVGGGAERIALDLHRTYQARGADARLAVGFMRGDPSLAGVVSLDPRAGAGSAWARWLRRLAPDVQQAQSGVAARVRRRALYALASPTQALRRARGVPEFEAGAAEVLALLDRGPASVQRILHLHNLHGGYFDLQALPELCAAVPVFVTLHDAWLTTGHCAHGRDCERWRTGCGDCPHLEYPPPLSTDRSAELWQAKRAVLARSALRVIAPSKYMARRVEDSILSPALRSLTVIPNGVDARVFKPALPGEKARLRASFGLPADAFVICYSAVGAQANPYKDTGTVLSVAERVAERLATGNERASVVLVVIGGQEQRAANGGGRLLTMGTGYLQSSVEVANWMRASDILVHSAHVEAFGLTSVEAQLCGLPVVVTATGGLPETMADGKSGFVAPEGDAEMIAALLVCLAREGELRSKMGEAAARFAAARFTLETMADRYLEYYACQSVPSCASQRLTR